MRINASAYKSKSREIRRDSRIETPMLLARYRENGIGESQNGKKRFRITGKAFKITRGNVASFFVLRRSPNAFYILRRSRAKREQDVFKVHDISLQNVCSRTSKTRGSTAFPSVNDPVAK